MKRKQLILVRHGRAVEANEFDGLDFNRPLTERWEKEADQMAKYLRLIGVKLDHIISSPSIRTMETAKIFADRMKINDIEYNPELYNGTRSVTDDGVKIYFQAVRNIAEKHDVVMVVGHNDDISLLGHYLTGDGVPFMKKGSVLVLSMPDDPNPWTSASSGMLEVDYYITPRFLDLWHDV